MQDCGWRLYWKWLHCTNRGVDCLILFKFGMWMHCGSMDAPELLKNPLPTKSNMVHGTQIGSG